MVFLVLVLTVVLMLFLLIIGVINFITHIFPTKSSCQLTRYSSFLDVAFDVVRVWDDVEATIASRQKHFLIIQFFPMKQLLVNIPSLDFALWVE